MRKIFTLLLICWSFACISQPTFPYNGVMPKDVTSTAIVHATLFMDPETRIDDATLIFEKGKIVLAGKGISIPANAVVLDMKGKFIYSSFIDLWSDYGITAPTGSQGIPGTHDGGKPTTAAGEKGAFGWNPAINATTDASELIRYKDDQAKEWRGIGFGAVLSHKHDGIVRGTGALIALGENPNISLIKPRAAAFYSFNKGSSPHSYPSSLMGSIALLRQTYYDMKWYASGGSEQERNLSLESMQSQQTLPSFFDAGDKWNVLRADKVGDEFGLQYIVRTNGNEYQRIDDVKATGATLIVPLAFPDVYDVSDPFVSRLVSLTEMKHWEMAPANCAMLSKSGIPFTITSAGLQDKAAFLKNLRKAISRGLSEADALRALTTTPAALLKVQGELGKLQTGMWANFIVCSGNIFEEGTVIHENWVQGERFVIDAARNLDITGTYQLQLPKYTYELKVKSEAGKIKSDARYISKPTDANTKPDTLNYAVNISSSGELLTISFEANDAYYKGVIRLAGDVNDAVKQWKGRGQDDKGNWFEWSSTRTEESVVKKDEKKPSEPEPAAEVIYPFTAFGQTKRPQKETVLIKNATIWTCEKSGRIENAELLISGGKIVALGKNIDVTKYPDCKVIDATGKHVTPGIIDEHSHIALESVNEGAQASSAEVQEAAVVSPEDIDIYRQLSGGVTCSQLLHGSANPIGGQSALIKLHWGGNADDMLVDDAPQFIKFALGENVKQSNWQNDGSRFPQTRMGVEQIYYDHFMRAREYGAEVKGASTASKKKGATASTANYRKDLEMDALLEILEGKRFVTCHSYVQSEINMLMHVADSMGFTLNTFTHILEGYKVADKMKSHGAGASSFSDWWAYKYEVKDAIPYNGALLWEQGITVAYNSDDAEMARRLNQEAAKAVKYGGVPEEEALKFVTLNPAKLLHIDQRTGSLAAGKDADVVIWSDNPLSIYARAEKTFVDGIRYFDLDEDKALRDAVARERARIIQKMLAAKQSGENTQMPGMKDKKHFHCDTLDETSRGISFK